ncbi:MAG: ATPase, partial [Crenarchaeota archaeon]|nr:ATPase [Thermoproteota archaeon]
VKLPTGLKEAELSRPVIEVRDFLTDELEYEIYTFGEQTVVIPVKKFKTKTGLGTIDKVVRTIKRILPGADISVDGSVITVTIPRKMIRTYNRKLKRLRKLEDKYNVSIRIRIA